MCFKRYATSLWDPLCSQKMHVQLQQGYDAQSANLVTVLLNEQCKCKSYRHLLQATNKASKKAGKPLQFVLSLGNFLTSISVMHN